MLPLNFNLNSIALSSIESLQLSKQIKNSEEKSLKIHTKSLSHIQVYCLLCLAHNLKLNLVRAFFGALRALLLSFPLRLKLLPNISYHSQPITNVCSPIVSSFVIMLLISEQQHAHKQAQRHTQSTSPAPFLVWHLCVVPQQTPSNIVFFPNARELSVRHYSFDFCSDHHD